MRGMRVSIRTRFIIMLAVASLRLLLSGDAARAADYAVKIGADTRSGQETSSMLCWFDHRCHGELKELGLQVDVDVRRSLRRIARLRLRGNSRGCCTFENGRDETAIDLRRVILHKEPLYKGKNTKGGIVIENERVGSLYMKFLLVSPDRDDRRGAEQPI